jgi:hypothetical protein
MVILLSGNVGIGTTAPGLKFHVSGSNEFARFENPDSTTVNSYAQINLRAGTANSYLWTANNVSTAWGGPNSLNVYAGAGGAMALYANGTEYMRITTGGLVGIGTAAPAVNLHVVKPTYSNTVPVVRFDNGTQTAVQSSYDTALVVQPDVPALRLIETNTGVLGTQQELSLAVGDGDAVIRSSDTATNGLSLMTNAAPGGAGYNEGVGTLGIKILNTGLVGIGTASPAYKLDVAGGIRTQGDIYTNSNYGYGLVGLYSSYRYQGVFAMDNAYRLSVDGTTPGNLYGIAWAHTNLGGETKAGLAHQALFMTNGVTQTAIGTGIWTNGSITAGGDISAGSIAYAVNSFRVNGSGYTIQDSNQFYCNNASPCYFNWSTTGVTNVGNSTGGVYIPGTLSLGAGLTFNTANPYITASSYFVAPGGAYFNSGTVYFASALQARGGVHNDNAPYLDITGGTTGDTRFSRHVFSNGGTTYGLYYNSGSFDTVGTGSAGDPLEINYYNAGDMRMYNGDFTMQDNRYIYPGSITAGYSFQKSWYLASSPSWGLYTNTSFMAAGGLYDAGNRVYSASNPAVSVGNVTKLNYVGAGISTSIPSTIICSRFSLGTEAHVMPLSHVGGGAAYYYIDDGTQYISFYTSTGGVVQNNWNFACYTTAGTWVTPTNVTSMKDFSY